MASTIPPGQPPMPHTSWPLNDTIATNASDLPPEPKPTYIPAEEKLQKDSVTSFYCADCMPPSDATKAVPPAATSVSESPPSIQSALKDGRNDWAGSIIASPPAAATFGQRHSLEDHSWEDRCVDATYDGASGAYRSSIFDPCDTDRVDIPLRMELEWIWDRTVIFLIQRERGLRRVTKSLFCH